MTSKRTDIELIGPSIATSTDPVERIDLPGLKRIRINGVEVDAASIAISGASGRAGSETVTVSVSLLPSSIRFITAAQADNADPVLVVEQVNAALTEALTMANNRVQQLERQLKAHHDHDAALTTADDVLARAAERVRAFMAEERPRVNNTYGSSYLNGIQSAIDVILDDSAMSTPAPAPQGDDSARQLRDVEELLDHYNAPAGAPAERIRALIRTAVDEATQVQGELNGMHHRERMVDRVLDSWENGRLKGYTFTIDPETPAGRLVEFLHDFCKHRPTTRGDADHERKALRAIADELGKYGLAPADRDYADGVVAAVRGALKARADGAQQLRTIDAALRMYAESSDPMVMPTKNPSDTAARVVEELSVALHQFEAIGRTIASIPEGDEAEGRTIADRVLAAFTALTDPAQRDTGAAAAARIRQTASDAEMTVREGLAANDAVEFDAYLAGLERAAQIAADETPEADPNVAHIDTVNGRQRPAQAPETLDPDPNPGEDTAEGRGPDERHVGAQLRHPHTTGNPEEME